MEKREQLYTDANVDWYSHYGKQHGVSSKILKKKKKNYHMIGKLLVMYSKTLKSESEIFSFPVQCSIS
jgi:hypothetical protein